MIVKDMVIHKIFESVAAEFPDRVALQIQDGATWQRVTYDQVRFSAKAIAAFMIKQGYGKDSCVALILENRPEWVMVYLGIIYAGLVCVAIDLESAALDLDNIFRDCRPVAVFSCDKVIDQKINRLDYQEAKIISVDSGEFKNITGIENDQVKYPEVYPDDIASLIYTSGTTAKPKGVMLTHNNFCANFYSIKELNIFSASDNFLSILPLYHTYAFMVTFLVPLLISARITYMNSLKPEDLTNIIREAAVTVLVGVPQLFSLIHKAIFDKINKIPAMIRPLVMPLIKKKVRRKFGNSLRLLTSGGARLEPRVGKGLTRMGFKTIEGYGLTETSPVATFNPPERTKFGSAGKAIPGVKLRILNPDKSGIGEVLIKGENVMRGYFKRPDLTRQVISEDGWFNSQDLGYLDKEGYLFLSGRKKDVIVLSSGKNIYPEELEQYYNQSLCIKEICIFGKTQERFGQEVELLFAVIVPDFDYFRNNKAINIRQQIRWELENLSVKLPAYKRIMGFAISKLELPRTRLKKIKRFEVSRSYSGSITPQEPQKRPEFSAQDKAILNSRVGKRIIEYLSRQLKKEVGIDSHLEIDLGIDSLGRVELGLGLESLFLIKVPQGLIDNALTVKELIINIREVAEDASQRLVPERQKSWKEILNELPTQDVLDNIKVNSGFLDKLFTRVFKGVISFIFRLFWRLKVNGKEFIPPQGPYLFCSNHASFLDGFILFAGLPARSVPDLFFIGHAKIFEHPLVSWTVRVARLISIDPVRHLTEALQAARFVLGHKKIVCIFPEGTRSVDGEIQDFKKGIGILAKELDIMIIPVYIKGSHYAWPRAKKFPRIYPLRIIFGKPVHWQELGNDYAAITEKLRIKVISLKDNHPV
ncbi:MAG: AMP-binding protein [Candidatus Omnitrophota bacterium]